MLHFLHHGKKNFYIFLFLRRTLYVSGVQADYAYFRKNRLQFQGSLSKGK